jgi:drug/metabolite transporter (DMT)-like permease
MRNRKLPERWLGIAAVATVMVVFGITFVAIKIALVEIEPLTLAFGRFLIALILFSPFLGRRREGVQILQSRR